METVEKFLSKMKEEEISRVVALIADRYMLIPNWYHKEHIENMIGEKIDENTFADFLEYHNKISESGGWELEHRKGIKEIWDCFKEDE
jgi:hypothetical protein